MHGKAFRLKMYIYKVVVADIYGQGRGGQTEQR